MMLPELWPNFSAGIMFPIVKKKKVGWRCLFAFILYYIFWDFSPLLPLMLETQLQENNVQSYAFFLLIGLKKILHLGSELVLNS